MSSDSTPRFRTYFNYVSALAGYMKRENSEYELYSEVAKSAKFCAIQTRKASAQQLDEISRHLRNAWFTEMQMELSALIPELMGYSNHWAPVQLYYSTYLGLRALFSAMRQNAVDKHANSLKHIASEIGSRPDIFPLPLRVTCKSKSEFFNLPSGIIVNTIQALEPNTAENFWDRYAAFLRTTRDRLLNDKCDEWKKRNKKQRIDSTNKRLLNSRLGATSLFDCLYRMRIRSNYQDADSFLLSIVDDVQISEFHESLRTIAWHTLLSIELLIARYIGVNTFELVLQSLVQADKHDLSSHLSQKRWIIINDLLS